eukprot:80487-Lingulodinium_polyedra.AAC.1
MPGVHPSRAAGVGHDGLCRGADPGEQHADPAGTGGRGAQRGAGQGLPQLRGRADLLEQRGPFRHPGGRIHVVDGHG